MQKRTIHNLIQTFVFCIVILLSGSCSQPVQSPNRLSHSAYIWQETWEPADIEIARISSSSLESFYILAANITCNSGSDESSRIISIPWSGLTGISNPAVPVIRMDVSCLEEFAESRIENYTDKMALLCKKITNGADQAGRSIDSFQFDLDCPTNRISMYSRLLEFLRKKLKPETKISITVLPDWLRSNDFRKLASRCDYYVLQVHSLEKPDRYENDYQLYNEKKVMDSVLSAASFKIPFFLALPSYGYHLVFDPEGVFRSISTQYELNNMTSDVKVRTVISDPIEMMHIIHQVKSRKEKFLQGIIWFRLPGHEDTLTWPWITLESVMKDQKPAPKYVAEMVPAESGVYDIRISNTGAWEAFRVIRCRISGSPDCIAAYDIFDSFLEKCDNQTDAVCFEGPAPRIGQPVTAGWIRLKSNRTASECGLIPTMEVIP